MLIVPFLSGLVTAGRKVADWFGLLEAPNHTTPSASAKGGQQGVRANQVSAYVQNAELTIAHFRQTSTWILGVFAAVAALLLAGMQLSSIGRLPAHPWLENHRLIIAVGSVVFGVLTAGVVIWAAAAVLRSGRASITELAELEKADEQTSGWWRKQTHPDLLVVREMTTLEEYKQKNHATMLRDFKDTYYDTFEKYNDIGERLIRDPSSVSAADHKNFAVFKRKIPALREQMQEVLATVKMEQVRRTFTWSRNMLFIFGFLTALCITGFAWAANPSEIPLTPILYPSQATLVLTADEVETLAARLGAGCVESTMDVVLLSGQESTFDVITVPDDLCGVARFSAGAGAIGVLRDPR